LCVGFLIPEEGLLIHENIGSMHWIHVWLPYTLLLWEDSVSCDSCEQYEKSNWRLARGPQAILVPFRALTDEKGNLGTSGVKIVKKYLNEKVRKHNLWQVLI
jgi:hypothetical protein